MCFLSCSGENLAGPFRCLLHSYMDSQRPVVRRDSVRGHAPHHWRNAAPRQNFQKFWDFALHHLRTTRCCCRDEKKLGPTVALKIFLPAVAITLRVSL